MSPTLLASSFTFRLRRLVFRHPCVLVGRPVDGDRRFWNMPEPSSPSLSVEDENVREENEQERFDSTFQGRWS